MITKHLGFKGLANVARFYFSGGHHKVYDWRDDHKANPSYEEDSRNINTKDPAQYQFPFKADPYPWYFSSPNNYNQKDLTQNLVGSNKPNQIMNALRPAEDDMQGDIAHEMDYQSQDLDFQPESFKTQHFRKKGQMVGWIIASSIPIWFVVSELFIQGWSDQDNYRYQRAPPLHYPDEEETPDAIEYLVYQTKQYNEFLDAGIVKRPFYKIQDGKKIYTKYSGVNQPYPVPNDV